MSAELEERFYFEISLRVWAKDLEHIKNFLKLRLSDRTDQISQIESMQPKLLKDGRYYAAIADFRTSDSSNLIDKVQRIINLVSQNCDLCYILNENEVTANIWISVLGKQSAPQLVIPELIIKDADRINIDIFCEDYTNLVDGNSHKNWFIKNKSK